MSDRTQVNLSLDEATLQRLDAWRDGSGATRPSAALALLKRALDMLNRKASRRVRARDAAR